ncbi:MAG: uracil-DNA glycosylase [Alphaproteobacteria bacterium]|nr:uracil-DNA glycosylase [Alphaproteobacteria bacterium]
METTLSEYQILDWYVAAGVDETVCDEPVNRFEQTKKEHEERKSQKPVENKRIGAPAQVIDSGQNSKLRPSLRSASARLSDVPSDAVATAKKLALSASSLDELRVALEGFDGCSLKLTATNMVFGDGNLDADVMFVGEAPSADEDREGVPFVGRSGQLLDKMMQSIGLDRTNAYLSNIINWRPPGNRSPTLEETAVCVPFIERHIELVNPKIVVLLGGSAANAILEERQSISRIRGKWFETKTSLNDVSYSAIPTFHPAYLLRSPAQKKGAWQDLIKIMKLLEK